RAGAAHRAGDAEDQELRQEVAQRDQGVPAGDGAVARHAARELPQPRGARPPPRAAGERDGLESMRHRVAGVKLNRSPSHRRALFRNLVTALLQHEAVRTTDAKAKELKRWGDRMITLGKQGTLHARRRAAALIHGHAVVKKLFDELAPRYQSRQGGYTRVVKLGVRAG